MINFPVLGFKAQEAFILKMSILFGHFKTRTCKNILCADWINRRQDRVELQNSPEKTLQTILWRGIWWQKSMSSFLTTRFMLYYLCDFYLWCNMKDRVYRMKPPCAIRVKGKHMMRNVGSFSGRTSLGEFSI